MFDKKIIKKKNITTILTVLLCLLSRHPALLPFLQLAVQFDHFATFTIEHVARRGGKIFPLALQLLLRRRLILWGFLFTARRDGLCCLG